MQRNQLQLRGLSFECQYRVRVWPTVIKTSTSTNSKIPKEKLSTPRNSSEFYFLNDSGLSLLIPQCRFIQVRDGSSPPTCPICALTFILIEFLILAEIKFLISAIR